VKKDGEFAGDTDDGPLLCQSAASSVLQAPASQIAVGASEAKYVMGAVDQKLA
jgi:hypothetical protein